MKNVWRFRESNPVPLACEASALPNELNPRGSWGSGPRVQCKPILLNLAASIGDPTWTSCTRWFAVYKDAVLDHHPSFIAVEIIRDSDLATCTAKSVKAALAERLGRPLEDEQEAPVEGLIDKVLEEQLGEMEDERMARALQEQELQARGRRARRAPATERRPRAPTKTARSQKSTKTGFHRPMVLSDALSEVVGGERLVALAGICRMGD